MLKTDSQFACVYVPMHEQVYILSNSEEKTNCKSVKTSDYGIFVGCFFVIFISRMLGQRFIFSYDIQLRYSTLPIIYIETT